MNNDTFNTDIDENRQETSKEYEHEVEQETESEESRNSDELIVESETIATNQAEEEVKAKKVIDEMLRLHEQSSESEENTAKIGKSRIKGFVPLIASVVLLALAVVTKESELKLIYEIAAVAMSGFEVLKRGVKTFVKMKPDESTLMIIAVVSAFFVGKGFDAALAVVLFGLSGMICTVLNKKIHNRIDSFVAAGESTCGEFKVSAEVKRSKLEQKSEKTVNIFVICVIITAIFLTAIPMFFGEEMSKWLTRSLTLLVAACPCAVLVSLPAAFSSAIGAAAGRGIYIRGSRFAEKLSELDSVAFESEGVLSDGKLVIRDVYSLENVSSEALVKLAAACYDGLEDKISKAFCGKNDGSLKLERLDTIRNKGVICKMNGYKVLCGSKEFMKENNVELSGIYSSTVYVALNGQLMGAMVLAEGVNEEASRSVSELKKMGVRRMAVFSSKEQENVKKVAYESGIKTCFWELDYESRADKLSQMKKNASALAYVCKKSANDGLAAEADVYIMLGEEAVSGVSDVYIPSGKLPLLCSAISISKKAIKRIYRNITALSVIKAVVIILSLFGLMSMSIAVLIDMITSAAVMLATNKALLK